jgi:hypothetical protein
VPLDRFLLVEGSFCASTRAGMVHAYLLLTLLMQTVNAANTPSAPPALENLPLMQNGNSC